MCQGDTWICVSNSKFKSVHNRPAVVCYWEHCLRQVTFTPWQCQWQFFWWTSSSTSCWFFIQCNIHLLSGLVEFFQLLLAWNLFIIIHHYTCNDACMVTLLIHYNLHLFSGDIWSRTLLQCDATSHNLWSRVQHEACKTAFFTLWLSHQMEKQQCQQPLQWWWCCENKKLAFQAL